MLVLGVVAVLAVIIGVGVAIWLARQQASDDVAPPSAPADFVSPVSSGGFRFRTPDESKEEFKDRVAKEDEEFRTQSQRAPKID